MRCPRCGNENPATNRFCGMCGTTLLPAPAPVAAHAEAATAAAPTPRPAASAPVIPPAAGSPQPSYSAPAPRSPEPESETVINGPSFLGLNQPAPSSAKTRRGSLSIDPGSHSGNLEYLLEDEEPRRGGAGKIILIVVALLLAVGFGYLRFRNGGLSWLNSSAKKPAATVEQSDGGDASGPSQALPSGTASSPSPSAPAASGSITPEPAPATGNAAASPAASTAPSTNAPADSGAAAVPPSGEKGGSATPAVKDVAKDAAASKDSAAPAPAKDSDEDSSADESETRAPKAKPPAAAPKPSPVAPVDVVAQAQKYIYGKGAAQDCDRGMRLLKPAADRGDTKAMIQMGALYSAGLCAPHDLPTSYRWFAKALHKEPDNMSVQNDLQKLWSEMTQPERQLAIRLSQ